MSHGGMASFNINDGFCEAMVRGLRSGFLKDEDYHHLARCETIEDVKLNLQETDYGEKFLQNEPSPVPPPVLGRACRDKWVREFNYLRAQAVEPLSTFLEFITYEYIIDNVLMILKATLADETVDPKLLLAQAHPLGRFKESTMKAIAAFDNSPRGYEELYATVLIDTPVGKYFQQFLQDQAARKVIEGGSEARTIFEEVPYTTLKYMIEKLYLEDFYYFCKKIGGATGEIMGSVLEARADQVTISITMNSFTTMYNEANQRSSSRRGLYPCLGQLYPEGIKLLSKVDTEDKLGRLLDKFPDYRHLWESAPLDEDNVRDLDSVFYERNVRLLELCFDGQFHYGMFYAYVKLKEQETRNLEFLCECVMQGRTDQMKVVPIFSRSAKWRK